MSLKKNILFSLLTISGSKIPTYFNEITRLSTIDREELKLYQLNKLSKLLKFSKINVPYYKDLLGSISEHQIENETLKVFRSIPPIDKPFLQTRSDEIRSINNFNRKQYSNHSGGSTGYPTTFLQDNHYSDWNIANSIFIRTFANVYPGDKEFRFWGSEVDILNSKKDLYTILRNRIYNRTDFDVFFLDDKRLEQYVNEIIHKKPKWIEGYNHALFDIARFILKHGHKVSGLQGVLSTAEVLSDDMYQLLRKAFNAPIFDRYGSREAGGMACSCDINNGLHVFPWNHYFEILDKNQNEVKPGETGQIHITTLNNYTMPLIRYKIGDFATQSEHQFCRCGRSMPVFKRIESRESNRIYSRDGRIVSPIFVRHFLGVVHNQGIIQKYQLIQNDYEDLEIKIVVSNEKEFSKSINEIEASFRKIMGENCKIKWTFVEEIPPLKSGKYQYVINKMSEKV